MTVDRDDKLDDDGRTAEQELRQKCEKEQCGFDVEGLDQDALQQSRARAR